MFDSMIDLPMINRFLAGHSARMVPADGRARTAVAMLLRQGNTGAEVLFILRARHEGDPWSGNIGFPGGRIEPGDPSPRAAAERETEEELGLQLASENYLGQMDDIVGAHLPVLVSCYAYRVDGSAGITPNGEIDSYFWTPVSQLIDPARRMEAEVVFGGERFIRPAICLLSPTEPVLWGITYRLVMGFLRILGLEGREDT